MHVIFIWVMGYIYMMTGMRQATAGRGTACAGYNNKNTNNMMIVIYITDIYI